MTDRRLTVFGGSGFLGRQIVRQALCAGWDVRVAVRCPRPELFAADARQPAQCAADIRERRTVEAAVHGATAVVNAVGLYTQGGNESFEQTHVTAAGHVARAAKQASARLVHVSGVGVDPRSQSAYVRARAQGEERVLEANPECAILRPGAMFGDGDALLCAMVPMIRRLPVVPLFGDGSSRVQPVHVDDVARAVLAALVLHDARGATYELGGPGIYTYRELLDGIAGRLGRKRWYLPVPFAMWRLLAVLASLLPDPPITPDQVELVRRDNVVGGDRTFEELGIDRDTLANILDAVGPTRA